MCQYNKPLVCYECAFLTVRQHLSVGNIGNLIKCIINENKSLQELMGFIQENLILFQSDKEYNSVLSGVCYHKNENEIITFLPIIKMCNYRYDKWYLHNSLINKKDKIVEYLLKHGCPLRQQHLQSAICSENKLYIKSILKKYEDNLGEKIQKNIGEWLIQIKDKEIYKMCMPSCILNNHKILFTVATSRNYYLLYLFLQKIGLQLTQTISNKILEICYENLLVEKGKIMMGMEHDIEKIREEEKSKWYKECIEWCEMSVAKRYFKFIKDRNDTILKLIEDDICKDMVNIVISYL
jgi:hypothetical protein